MKIEQLKTSELARMASPYNPRRISEHDLEALRRSMRLFGTVEPVVVNRRSRRIAGGHQRVVAAQAEGIDTLPVVHVDLDDPSERMLNLALNKISGEFDPERLAAVLADLQSAGADLGVTGFTDAEIEELVSPLDEPTDGLTDPDAVPEPPDEPATQVGDLIVLGGHRLLCGDTADVSSVRRLLEGKSVHLVHTDPPYNVKSEPRSKNAIASGFSTKGNVPSEHRKRPGKMRPRDRELMNDSLPEADFEKVLRAWLKNLAEALLPGRGFFIWGGFSNMSNFPLAIAEVGLYFSQTIIWVKEWPVMNRKDFMGNHEWCFYGWKKGKAHYFHPGIHNATDVWSVKKVNPMRMVHLTEKPVELAERAITYSSKKGERVLDLFGGSGSTLIAAERMDRQAFLMELDPAYCDVIVSRWQNFTGQKAQGWRGNAPASTRETPANA